MLRQCRHQPIRFLLLEKTYATLLEQTLDAGDRANWTYYVCGSKGMVEGVVKTLRSLGIPSKRILYEQLAF